MSGGEPDSICVLLRQHRVVAFSLAVASTCNGFCFSLQAPFYPREAEQKGCTATGGKIQWGMNPDHAIDRFLCSEYNLVFSVYQLVVFLVGPVIGYHVSRWGMKVAIWGGSGFP